MEKIWNEINNLEAENKKMRTANKNAEDDSRENKSNQREWDINREE